MILRIGHQSRQRTSPMARFLFPISGKDNVALAPPQELFLAFPNGATHANNLNDATSALAAPGTRHFSQVRQRGPDHAKVLSRTPHDSSRGRWRKIDHLQTGRRQPCTYVAKVGDDRGSQSTKHQTTRHVR